MLFARSDLASVTVSPAHGGCGTVHVRPAPGGNPDPMWKLDCAPCESHLRGDPLWSPTVSEIAESPDEESARVDAEKRGERAAQKSQADANAALAAANIRLADRLEQFVSAAAGSPPGVPAIAGKMVCDAGHDCEPGLKFCGQCGIPLRAAAACACPDGHEVASGMRFCGECGRPVASAAPQEPEPAPAAIEPPAPVKRLEDMRAADLKALARERGVDDSGTRAQLLGRLRAA